MNIGTQGNYLEHSKNFQNVDNPQSSFQYRYSKIFGRRLRDCMDLGSRIISSNPIMSIRYSPSCMETYGGVLAYTGRLGVLKLIQYAYICNIIVTHIIAYLISFNMF